MRHAAWLALDVAYRGTVDMIRRRSLALLATLAAPLPLRAQEIWAPSRPVRLVVPFAAGGLTDILARGLTDGLSARLGQPVVVENRAGAAGNIAGETVARAPADGHTVLVASQGVILLNSALFQRLPYDPDRDFVPLAIMAHQPNLFVVNPRVLPVSNIAELIQAARSRPGGVPGGSPGTASFAHINLELLRYRAGVELPHVAFRGSAPMLTALLGGDIPFGVDAVGTSLPLVRDGRLRALAVGSAERLRALPDIPAVAETLPGFDASAWYGLFAHSATPEGALARLDREIRAVMASEPYRRLLDERLAEPVPDTRAQLATRLERERQVWREVVRVSGARAE
jgi:tripartite-type tricarboxylate transporter receptor subunit TctC